jgi:hypothetical protein
MILIDNVDTVDPKPSEPSGGYLEFVSGNNVTYGPNQELKLDFEIFEKVGQEQTFSMTLKNNSNLKALSNIKIKYPTDYFELNYQPKFEVQPGETKTYTFSIILVEVPTEDIECNCTLKMDTTYKNP